MGTSLPEGAVLEVLQRLRRMNGLILPLVLTVSQQPQRRLLLFSVRLD